MGKHHTISGRTISYYGANIGESIFSTSSERKITLDDFFEILLHSWVKESAYPSAQTDPEYCLENDPTYGQCAITAMAVQKEFGGSIHKIRVNGGGTHYFNKINGQIVDLTRDQFDLYNIPVSYLHYEDVPLEYCGKNADTHKRYEILEKNILKNTIPTD